MMTCTVFSADSPKVFEEVVSVTLPAATGEMEVLPMHAESFVLLQKGDVVVRFRAKTAEVVPVEECAAYVHAERVVIIS